MEIKEVLTEETWEKFVLSQPHTPFLQSWAWGEFQETVGLSHHRLGLFHEGKMVGGVQAFVGGRKLGRFVYVPHGPLVKSEVNGREPVLKIFEYLKQLAEEEKADYLRAEPPWEATAENRERLKKLGFRPAAATPQGGGTVLLLDLRPSEEELLQGMRKSTRQRIRQGREMGVEVQRSRDPEMMRGFYRLMTITSKRQGFTPHSRRYLQTQFETLAPRGMAELYLARYSPRFAQTRFAGAKYQGDVLAALILITYGDTATSAHGATVRSKIPASHLLRWETIKQAKRANCNFYNFWGIAPTDDPRHPWYGYSHFKKGFGGQRVDYIGVWDFPLTKRHLAVAGVERVRKLLRRC